MDSAKQKRHVPEFIYPVFVKTSPKRSISMTEKEHFGLVFAKTGSVISGSGVIQCTVQKTIFVIPFGLAQDIASTVRLFLTDKTKLCKKLVSLHSGLNIIFSPSASCLALHFFLKKR
jgi:hypothetical protein